MFWKTIIPNGAGWKKYLQKLPVKKICPTCGLLQPLIKKKKKDKIEKECGIDIQLKYTITKKQYKYPTGIRSDDRIISPSEVHKIFSRISEKDAAKIGFKPPYSHPASMILTVLPIPPPCIRPSLSAEGIVKGEDDLTSKLVEIVRANKKLISKGMDIDIQKNTYLCYCSAHKDEY